MGPSSLLHFNQEENETPNTLSASHKLTENVKDLFSPACSQLFAFWDPFMDIAAGD